MRRSRPVPSENLIHLVSMVRHNHRIIKFDACDPAPDFDVWSHIFKSRRRLEAENLFLRYQLNVALRRAAPRLGLHDCDRALLVWMTRNWPRLLDVCQVVKPETVLRWHRSGFKVLWRWKSRNRAGRPKVNRELRDLIRRMSGEDPLKGAPWIHGELLRFEVAQFDGLQIHGAEFGGRRRNPGRRFFKTTLRQSLLLMVPSLTFERLFAFVVLGDARRQLLWFEVTRIPQWSGWHDRSPRPSPGDRRRPT